MFDIGASLREARSRRGLTPADVQKDLRIRERYLTALEEERWELLPGDAYVKGFLRTYAEYLGLDGQLYIEEYNSRFIHRDESVVPDTISAPRSRRSGAFRLLSLLAIVGGVAALAAWQLGGGTHTPSRSSAAGAGDAAAALSNTKPALKVTPARVARRHAVFAVVSATRGRSWVMIRSGGETGKILYQGILEQGQHVRFGVGAKLWVRMGRPSTLDIKIDGRPIGGLPSAPTNVVLTRSGAESA